MKSLEVYDFEALCDDGMNFTLILNKTSVEDLIEKLEYLRDSNVNTSHVHLNTVSGLNGDLNSMLIMLRQ
jgi:hypothetical protein